MSQLTNFNNYTYQHIFNVCVCVFTDNWLSQLKVKGVMENNTYKDNETPLALHVWVH